MSGKMSGSEMTHTPQKKTKRVEKISHPFSHPKPVIGPQVLQGLLRLAAGRADDELHVRLRRLPLQPALTARVVGQPLCGQRASECTTQKTS